MTLNNIQQTILENGLRIVTDSMPYAQSVTLGIWTGTGSRYETASQNGISHLLEHMVFKGTENRTAEKLYEEVDSVGGQMNAYTDKENTAYFIKLLGKNMPFGVDIISDMIRYPTFPDEELAKEQDVIIQEINMYADTPDDLVQEFFEQTSFPDQPIGRSILGTIENIKSFTSQDLHNYLNNFYHTGSMVWVAAGQVHHDSFVQEVKKHWQDFSDHKKKNIYDACCYKGGLTLNEKELEQVHMMIGFESVPHSSPLATAGFLTNIIFGSSDSSRINKEIREKRGLAYSAYSFLCPYLDQGLFCVYAGTGQDKAKEAFDVIKNEFYNLRKNINEAELARAKTQAEAALLIQAEDSYYRADKIGRQTLLLGQSKSYNEILESINITTKDDINKFINVVINKNPTISILGPSVKNLLNNDPFMIDFPL